MHRIDSKNTSPDPKGSFRNKVYSLVAQIPYGRVMNYGQVAALCGNPRAARIVGGVAHNGPEYLPWQRIVRQDGGLASGYYGGLKGHKTDLEKEGIKIINYRVVDITSLRWWPDE